MATIKTIFAALFLFAFLAAGAPASAQTTTGTTTVTTTPGLPETGVGGDAARNLTLLAATLALAGGAAVALRKTA